MGRRVPVAGLAGGAQGLEEEKGKGGTSPPLKLPTCRGGVSPPQPSPESRQKGPRLHRLPQSRLAPSCMAAAVMRLRKWVRLGEKRTEVERGGGTAGIVVFSGGQVTVPAVMVDAIQARGVKQRLTKMEEMIGTVAMGQKRRLQRVRKETISYSSKEAINASLPPAEKISVMKREMWKIDSTPLETYNPLPLPPLLLLFLPQVRFSVVA